MHKPFYMVVVSTLFLFNGIMAISQIYNESKRSDRIMLSFMGFVFLFLFVWINS